MVYKFINGCSERENSDSILDMIYSSTVHIPIIFLKSFLLKE